MPRTPDWTIPALLALLLVPWSVQVFSGRDATFVFAWGLLNTNPLQVTNLYEFLFVYTMGLPEYIYSWPLSVVLYVFAVGFAVVAPIVGYEDRRVVAGLLATAGVAQLSFAQGFSFQPGRTAWPVGTVLMLGIAAYIYGIGRNTERDRSSEN
ncbi:TIGR04206 family protein [Halogeometricum borinquense]|uniref:TIGR04206 family protein n=1 Tax=Halogeometricum borinquense TaxID=60847 RepID=A0A6C0UDU8_9EURY|nr:TIGR04206 family protein [Halogeometricum borinquense]QIB73515.1 TIGR04206 family protein [Halogeometricum borinquense]QIQ77089.1 TIGR04206 family protein [Halogeometricum borinquense]